MPPEEEQEAAVAAEPWEGELDAAGLRAYVLGSLHLRGGTHDDLTLRIQRALGWYKDVLGLAPLWLPGQAIRARGVLFSWVYDIGHLLLEGERFRFSSLERLGDWPEAERGLRLEYENRLLNGFLRDPSTRKAIELIRLDPSRDKLVAYATTLLLAPLLEAGGHEQAPVVDSVLLRELAVHGQVDCQEEALRYDARTGQEGALLGALRSSLERFFSRRGTDAALGPGDLAAIDHWSAFKKAPQREAGKRIVALSAGYPRVDPRGMAVAEEEETDTELPDSGYYPQGGFAELATRGPIENLVPTELVYMGEDAFGDDPNPVIDLFALRFLESEALFYQRDSGQLRRTRRTVHVAVAPDPGLRYKLPWHDDPLVVLVYGLLVRLSEDLAQIFPLDALRVEIHIVCPAGASDERAREDRELLRVLLRHEIARGAAEVYVRREDLDLRARGERARRVDGLAIQSGDRPAAGLPATPAPPLEEGRREPRIIVWKIGGIEPGPEETSVVYMPEEGRPEAALVLARNAILAEIAGVKGKGVATRTTRQPARRLPRGLRRGTARGEVVNTRDGSILGWVPAGIYQLGTDEANPERNLMQRPFAHRLQSGFYMGKHPVTWKQFRRFCRETGRKPPRPRFEVGPEHPVHGISFADATAYAGWAGLRLPLEVEWECAARGNDGRPWPWGQDEPGGSPPRLNCDRPPNGSEGTTTPVGSFPDSASPCGCQDTSGNVWEWVVTPDAQVKGHFVRGGCWRAPARDCRTFSRARLARKSYLVGFRVCRSG